MLNDKSACVDNLTAQALYKYSTPYSIQNSHGNGKMDTDGSICVGKHQNEKNRRGFYECHVVMASRLAGRPGTSICKHSFKEHLNQEKNNSDDTSKTTS